jgi:1,4-dihydroxy-2-naphthoyl-CoA hydrolase
VHCTVLDVFRTGFLVGFPRIFVDFMSDFPSTAHANRVCNAMSGFVKRTTMEPGHRGTGWGIVPLATAERTNCLDLKPPEKHVEIPQFNHAALEDFRRRYQNTIVGNLGIELVSADGSTLVAEMPVDERHLNSQGLLHGGVSLLLAETLGSFASLCVVKGEKLVLGMCVSANHVGKAYPGDRLRSETRQIHPGTFSHVWHTSIAVIGGKPVCFVTLTVVVKDKNPVAEGPSERLTSPNLASE